MSLKFRHIDIPQVYIQAEMSHLLRQPILCRSFLAGRAWDSHKVA